MSTPCFLPPGQPEPPPRRDPYDNYGRPGQQDRYPETRFSGGQAPVSRNSGAKVY